MLLSVVLIVAGLLLLAVGGDVLLRGAVGLAVLLRMTPAVIGLTVVAAGTSVPELAVSAIAAGQGSTEITVGNVVGSNIFNIAFILGLCALLRPLVMTGNTLRLEYPVLVLVTLLFLVVADDGFINRLDATLLVAIYLAFTAYLVALVREQLSAREVKEFGQEVKELTQTDHQPQLPAWKCWSFVAVGIVLLAGGAEATVRGAVDLARLLGLSERVIALTIISAGTGLPEVVTSLVSSYRGRDEIAIGNVIGSNLFNLLGILGISALIVPLPVAPEIRSSDGWWMLGVTLLLFPVLRTGKRINRWEGGLLLAVYGVYLALLLGR